MLKEQKGITLVALVITIIVLLILAGVSISLVVGNNGVLNQASNAVTNTRTAEVKQAIQLALQTAETEYYAKMASEGTADRATVYSTEFIKALTNLGYTATIKDGGAITSTGGATVEMTGSDSIQYNVKVTLDVATGIPTIGKPTVVAGN